MGRHRKIRRGVGEKKEGWRKGERGKEREERLRKRPIFISMVC